MKIFSPADDLKAFSPSTFFIVIQTNFGLRLEIQLSPIMQVYIKASVSNKGKLRGVFYLLTLLLIIESNIHLFAISIVGIWGIITFVQDFAEILMMSNGTTSWPRMDWLRELLGHLSTRGRPKQAVPMWQTYLGTHAFWALTKVGHSLRSPCLHIIFLTSLPITCSFFFVEKYAKDWCAFLSDPKEIFAKCHSVINPDDYQTVRFIFVFSLMYLCMYLFVFNLLIELVSTSLCSLVFMTPAPVRTVRNACVLPYPLMSTRVLLKASYWMDGGRLYAVS